MRSAGRLLILLLILSSITAAMPPAEPPARSLKAVPFVIKTRPAHVTAVYDTGSQVFISDVSTPAVWRVDPVTGATAAVGTAGPGPDQYAQPGGFYPGARGAILLADHSGPKVLTLAPDGLVTGSVPTARRGVWSSSDSDVDMTRVDAKGFAYFVDRGSAFPLTGELSNQVDLVRLHTSTLVEEKIASLAIPRSERLPSGDGMVLTRSRIGDPADGWGVAPDGRVAIVRANPYRVDWLSPTGQIKAGPTIAVDVIPYTEQDREAARNAGGGSVGVGRPGGASSPASIPQKFAPNKPPFFPNDVVVSPAGAVWVMRSAPFGATMVTYDVFDATGARTDRVAFPAGSRVVGFGAAAVYVREGAADLRKYALR